MPATDKSQSTLLSVVCWNLKYGVLPGLPLPPLRPRVSGLWRYLTDCMLQLTDDWQQWAMHYRDAGLLLQVVYNENDGSYTENDGFLTRKSWILHYKWWIHAVRSGRKSQYATEAVHLRVWRWRAVLPRQSEKFSRPPTRGNISVVSTISST